MKKSKKFSQNLTIIAFIKQAQKVQMKNFQNLSPSFRFVT